MGDRGVIAVIQSEDDDDRVYLYTHWAGSELPQVVQAALARGLRWDDPAYLTRILFDELCPTRGEETGYGISTHIPDNSHPIIVVDAEDGEVRVEPGPYDDSTRRPFVGPWTFEAFLKLDASDLEELT